MTPFDFGRVPQSSRCVASLGNHYDLRPGDPLHNTSLSYIRPRLGLSPALGEGGVPYPRVSQSLLDERNLSLTTGETRSYLLPSCILPRRLHKPR